MTNIQLMKDIAVEKGGECLSNLYINAHTKLQWQCNKKHIWLAEPNSIKQGSWCPYCAKKQILMDQVEEINRIASLKGGKCLSNIYTDWKTKMTFQCIEGHVWKALPSKIKNGCWCPYCNININEEICREIFKLAFKDNFERIRLIPNPESNQKLELDGYNKSLHLAFEYNGRQHYQDGIFGNDTLKSQIYRDDTKIKYCNENAIVLIIIPYTIKSSTNELYEYIKNEYFKITKNTFPSIILREINIHSLYNRFKLKKMIIYAENNGGKCLSTSYINYDTPIEFQCAEKHIWKMLSSVIKRGGWCPICRHKIGGEKQVNPNGLYEMQEIAKIKGGKCLSVKYINAQTPLEFECDKSHVWKNRPNNIKQGQWCPYCAKCKILNPLEELQNIAKNKGGKCLSTEYIGCFDKMEFQCKEGHKWSAFPSNIKRNQWCPKCSKFRHRYNIDDMKKLAIDKNGLCLSNTYNGSKSPLIWQCSCGYQWNAIPNSIIQGSWCPECAKKKRAENHHHTNQNKKISNANIEMKRV